MKGCWTGNRCEFFEFTKNTTLFLRLAAKIISIDVDNCVDLDLVNRIIYTDNSLSSGLHGYIEIRVVYGSYNLVLDDSLLIPDCHNS